MPAPVDRQRLVVVDVRSVPASPDLADVVAQVVRICFGVLAIAQGVAERTVGDRPAARVRRRLLMPAADLAELALATAWGAARLSGRVAMSGSRVVVPLAEVVVRPPLVPRALQPGEGARRLVARWRSDRPETVRALGRWSTTALPEAVDAALSQLELQRLVRIVLDHLDLDALVADVLNRLDLDQVAAQVLDGLDLDPVVAAAMERVDLDRIVLEQVDLIGLAEYVVDGIDLPEIIRDSTGTVASEAVRVMRLQGVEGDVAVARIVDRLLHRRRDRRLGTTAERVDDSPEVGSESPDGPK